MTVAGTVKTPYSSGFQTFLRATIIFIFKLTRPIYIYIYINCVYIYIYIYIYKGREAAVERINERELHHTPVSRPTEALRKDAQSENQITEGASDISRASAKGGHLQAVPPQTSYCAPHFPSSPLLAECDRFSKAKVKPIKQCTLESDCTL